MPHWIPGYHAVRKALQGGGKGVREVWIQEGRRSRRAEEIAGLARECGVMLKTQSAQVFSQHLPGIVHQGVAAVAERYNYAGLDELIRRVRTAGGRALVVAADHITDEGNLGAIIRTAAFFGAQGILIPKDRSAGISPRVVKRSAGALGLLCVARVVNLGRALDRLNQEGFWVIGAAGESPHSVYAMDWDRDLALVVGNEQKGLSPGVRKRCHELVRIPHRGAVSSLNVAVATGAILSELARQRDIGRQGAIGVSPPPSGKGEAPKGARGPQGADHGTHR